MKHELQSAQLRAAAPQPLTFLGAPQVGIP